MPAKMTTNKNVSEGADFFTSLPALEKNKVLKIGDTKFLYFILPIYDVRILLFLGSPEDASNVIYNLFELDQSGVEQVVRGSLHEGRATTFHFTPTDGLTVHYCFVNNSISDNERELDILSTMVHECSHLAWNVYHYIGTNISMEITEPVAYTVEFLFRKYTELFNSK